MKKVIVTPNGQTEVCLTEEEVSERIADQSAATIEISASLKKQRSMILLEESDLVAIRCVKAGVAFPQEWRECVSTLRQIVNGSDVSIPVIPDYPEGT